MKRIIRRITSMFNPAANAANSLSSASLGMANIQNAQITPQPYVADKIQPPPSNTTFVEVDQAENGWILRIKRKTFICTDLNDLSQQLVAAMVADRMEIK
jgi:hypothetical protein